MVLSHVMPSIKWRALAIFMLFCTVTKAQNDDLRGRVTDSLGIALEKATITFSPKDGGKVRRTITNNQGYFSIQKKGSKTYSVMFSMIGFKRDTLSSKQIAKLDSIEVTLHETSLMLEEVMVISHPQHPILISKDTISYDLASFAGKDDRYLSETLSRIKGLRVSQNGDVYAEGQKVTKIMLNDEEIFDGDVGLLTRNLPIDLLETAELVNDYGKESTITGIKGEPTKIINIHTKNPSVKGGFGELNAGAGSKKTYNLNGTANYFDDKNQLSVTAGTNNVNKLNMLGSSVMDNSATSHVGQEGINRATNFAVNARTKINEGSQLYVSADQSNSFNRSFGESRTTTVQQGDDIDYTEDFARSSKDRVRRFNLRYDLSNSRFAVNVSPFIRSGKQRRDEQRDALFITTSDSARNYILNQHGTQDAIGLDGSVHYKFNKPKRTLAFKVKSEKEKLNERQSIYNDFNKAFDPLNLNVGDIRNRSVISPTIAYTEPVGKNGILELAYNRNEITEELERNTSDQTENAVDSLSGLITSKIVRNHLDARFQYQQQKWFYDIMLSYQNDYLKTNDQSQSRTTIDYKKLLPSLQITYQFSNQKSITLAGKQFYNLPAVYQIISIPTMTDPLFVYTGNLNLQAENNTQATLSYKAMNALTGSVFRANVDFVMTDNKITSNSAQLIEGEAQQYISLLNVDGYKRIGADYYFSKTLKNHKVIDLSGRFTYDNNPQYINSELNFGKNINIHQTVKLLWPVTKSLHLNPAVMYRLTDIEYGIEQADIAPISTVNLLMDIAYTQGKFSTRLGANKFINSGFSGNSYNNFIVNANVSYKVLEGACTLNLEVSDLLNNNTGIRRSIHNNTVSDLYVNRLSRYVMFSVNYKLGNLK